LRLNDYPAKICEAWRYNPPGSRFYSDPLLYNGLAIVSDGEGKLHAVRLTDGTAAWTSKQPHQLYSLGTPITDGKNLYFASSTDEVVSPMYGPTSGHLYAVRLSDGGLVWQSPDIEGARGKVIFGFDGNLFFGAWDTQIYAYTRQGNPVPGWPSPGVGIISSGPSTITSFSFANDRLYVSNGGLYALDRSGQIVDSFFPINTSVATLPTIVGDMVYIGLEVYSDEKTPEGTLTYHQVLEVKALNANNFKDERFTFHTDFPPGSYALTVLDGYIYFGAAERFFQVRADGSGFNRQMFLAGDGIGGTPIVRNGKVYVLAGDGNLYIVR
jgi:outer membrane protein assembly factor BamB